MLCEGLAWFGQLFLKVSMMGEEGAVGGDWLRWTGDLRGDAVFAGNVLLVVDVYFGEDDFAWFGFGGGELVENWGDGFAGEEGET